ncbi:MAG TPA: aminotransferase class V-fold PLP-dependent enzyme, partial [Candidatus Polarisedimenticolaceae bacterium]|nr:aminotransferase class V-fold PLP-dependent enzyme [Candidatus Polarisedimenticolaceae bacterium]
MRASAAPAPLDVAQIRADFPLLAQRVGDHALVYLDNAATTQKPRAVLAAIERFYLEDNANVHRGVYALSERATAAYEGARARVARFIGGADPASIVFTRGATESINLVAHSFGAARIGPGDEIVLTEMEHHSNIVPWQLLCERRGAQLCVVPFDDDGELRLEALEQALGPRTRLVAAVHVANSLGTINPVERIVELAHARGVPVLLDGAQVPAHLPLDVRALDCDFYVFSAHKLYGPTGVGVLYGKRELLETMPPWLGGGDMITQVSFAGSAYREPPHRFEAGTPPVAQAVGLSAALDYLEGVGLERVGAHESDLLAYATEQVSRIGQVRIIGTAHD